MKEISNMKEILKYVISKRDKWWIIPILVALLLLGWLLVITEISPLAPFMYSLF